MKKQELNKNIEKYPKLSKSFSYMKEVWQETFPNVENKLNQRMEERKLQAKL
jgi:hypothetical protein